MTIEKGIRDERLQCDINRKAAKIYKYEYLSGWEMLPSVKTRMREQTTFRFSPLGKL